MSTHRWSRQGRRREHCQGKRSNVLYSLLSNAIVWRFWLEALSKSVRGLINLGEGGLGVLPIMCRRWRDPEQSHQFLPFHVYGGEFLRRNLPPHTTHTRTYSTVHTLLCSCHHHHSAKMSFWVCLLTYVRTNWTKPTTGELGQSIAKWGCKEYPQRSSCFCRGGSFIIC